MVVQKEVRTSKGNGGMLGMSGLNGSQTNDIFVIFPAFWIRSTGGCLSKESVLALEVQLHIDWYILSMEITAPPPCNECDGDVLHMSRGTRWNLFIGSRCTHSHATSDLKTGNMKSQP